MTTTEHGYDAGPNPDDKEGKFPTFEEMFADEPWLHGLSPEALQARALAGDTYRNIKRATEEFEERGNARELLLGQAATGDELRQQAIDEHRGNDNPPLPQN